MSEKSELIKELTEIAMRTGKKADEDQIKEFAETFLMLLDDTEE